MNKFFRFFIFFSFCAVVFAADNDKKNIIDAQKREQILREYERIEAAKSELESYRTATRKLFKEREAQLLSKERDLNATLALIIEKEKNISTQNALHEKNMKDLLEQNQKILDQLNSGNSDKMLEAYVKMKDGKVAEVLGTMPALDAAKLLYRMEAKKISSVLSKMDANKAVELTDLIKTGAIFDNNSTKENNNTQSPAENSAPLEQNATQA